MISETSLGGQKVKALTFVLIGAGGRGQRYSEYACGNFGCKMVAMADPNEDRRRYMSEIYGVPAEMCFESYEQLLEKGKIADFALVATQDRLHFAPAMMAIEKGYDLMLEKPVAPTAWECKEICRSAEEKQVRVLVCHVLRYTQFFRRVKDIVDSGKLGKIMSVIHTEGVGDIHQSHSCVRGPWHRAEESSSMLLAKSCHDIDLIQWLLGSKCKRVQSFGSLSYFTRENCPPDAPYRCVDQCPHADTCRYNALNIYLRDRRHLRHLISGMEITDEAIMKALRETNYGVCVFQSDNDVVDHQTVNMEFENGETAVFTMAAFNIGGRRIHLMGTKGELWSTDMNTIEINTFFDDDLASQTYGRAKHETIKVSEDGVVQDITGGHMGGDYGIVEDLCKYFGEGIATRSVSSIRTSVENHLTVFAAEKSREKGTVVDVPEFIRQVKK